MSLSSSKKPKPSKTNPTHNPGLRRSRSVSAFTRTQLDIASDFDNTRDNPLFWADGSDSSDQSVNDGENVRRGRSVTRNSVGGGAGGGGGGRSLSTVGMGRPGRRSLSRDARSGNSENKRKQESVLPNFRSNTKTSLNRDQRLLGGKNKLVGSASVLSEVLKGSNTWSSQHLAFETSDESAVSLYGSPTPHFDDGTFTRPPITEVAEKIIKPVAEVRKVNRKENDNETRDGILETVRTEVRRAISDMHKDVKYAKQRSESDVISDSMLFDVADVAPKFTDPYAAELVMDFRDEFTRELEECEERTRKLRAELAVEEHRELELTHMLSDMIPEPETPQIQKPRLIRKDSTERRSTSKCLEEEAMAYFDECVSISTFDESDFSSLEDPPSHKVRAGETSDVDLNRNSITWSMDSQDINRRSPQANAMDTFNLSTSGISDTSCRSGLNNCSRRTQFSFTFNLPDSMSHEQGIRNFVKRFSKGKEQDSSKSHVIGAVPQKSMKYDSEIPVEKYLLDRARFRSRIESGGMLLCGGVVGFPRSPFSPNAW